MFAKCGENATVDMTFIILMGHGHGDDNNCYIKTKSTNVANPREFEVWTNCKKLFGNKSHSLENKPKLFFIQTCRSAGCKYLSFNSSNHKIFCNYQQ